MSVHLPFPSFIQLSIIYIDMPLEVIALLVAPILTIGAVVIAGVAERENLRKAAKPEERGRCRNRMRRLFGREYKYYPGEGETHELSTQGCQDPTCNPVAIPTPTVPEAQPVTNNYNTYNNNYYYGGQSSSAASPQIPYRREQYYAQHQGSPKCAEPGTSPTPANIPPNTVSAHAADRLPTSPNLPGTQRQRAPVVHFSPSTRGLNADHVRPREPRTFSGPP